MVLENKNAATTTRSGSNGNSSSTTNNKTGRNRLQSPVWEKVQAPLKKHRRQRRLPKQVTKDDKPPVTTIKVQQPAATPKVNTQITEKDYEPQVIEFKEHKPLPVIIPKIAPRVEHFDASPDVSKKHTRNKRRFRRAPRSSFSRDQNVNGAQKTATESPTNTSTAKATPFSNQDASLTEQTDKSQTTKQSRSPRPKRYTLCHKSDNSFDCPNNKTRKTKKSKCRYIHYNDNQVITGAKARVKFVFQQKPNASAQFVCTGRIIDKEQKDPRHEDKYILRLYLTNDQAPVSENQDPERAWSHDTEMMKQLFGPFVDQVSCRGLTSLDPFLYHPRDVYIAKQNIVYLALKK